MKAKQTRGTGGIVKQQHTHLCKVTGKEKDENEGKSKNFAKLLKDINP